MMDMMDMMGNLQEHFPFDGKNLQVSSRFSRKNRSIVCPHSPAALRRNRPAVRAKVPPPLQQAISTAETRRRAAQSGEERR